MLSGARRARTPSLRQPGKPRPPEPPEDGAKVGLRLALAQGSLGMELAAPVRLGPLEVRELAIRLEDLRFPLDLSGGVGRFRHRRGRLSGGSLAVELAALARFFAPKLRGQLVPGAPVALTLAAAPAVLAVGLASDGAALAFDVVLAPLDGDLRLLVEDARGLGLSASPHVAAIRVLGAALKGMAERAGGAFVVRDPLGMAARRVLPDAGARAPSTRGIAISIADLDVAHAGLAGRADVPAEAPTSRAVRALEAAELAAAADEAALAGELEASRTAYLAALERAPRHPEIATRLAALDLWTGDRAEAALATLVDLAGPVEAGLLGSLVLEAVGETEAAYAAAARAAADEAFGPLSALAWLRASRLTTDARARTDALDRALVRAPGLRTARWERFRARLATGDLRGALGDAQHAEAAAAPSERFDVCKRAADELLARGHLGEAQAWFERALRQRPRSAAAVIGLARAVRDLGKTQRALDLFARAIELQAAEPDRDHTPDVEHARLLATYLDDRPAAVARVAEVPQSSPSAIEARLLEATWRAELGDRGGASRAAGRLRAAAEVRASAPPDEARAIAAFLVELAQVEDGLLSDARAAERDFALAVRLDPSNREAARALRRFVREAGVRPAKPEPSSPPAQPEPVAPLGVTFDVSDAGEVDEALVDRLTEKLRADPADEANAARLLDALERLGRDMEALALLSGRLEEVDEASRAPLEAARARVLGRLAQRARAEGRADEAALYESMIGPARG